MNEQRNQLTCSRKICPRSAPLFPSLPPPPPLLLLLLFRQESVKGDVSIGLEELPQLLRSWAVLNKQNTVTIWTTDINLPFEYQTTPVFRWLLYSGDPNNVWAEKPNAFKWFRLAFEWQIVQFSIGIRKQNGRSLHRSVHTFWKWTISNKMAFGNRAPTVSIG